MNFNHLIRRIHAMERKRDAVLTDAEHLSICLQILQIELRMVQDEIFEVLLPKIDELVFRLGSQQRRWH